MGTRPGRGAPGGVAPATGSVLLMGLVILLLVVAPLVELYVIIQVAHVIGAWETIALIVAESLLGAWILKRQGVAALDRIAVAIDEGRIPGRELVDGFLIMLAGFLMLAPGFITDILGFLLLLPPTRAIVRRVLQKRFEDGRYGRFFVSAGGRSGARFVGTFRAGPVYDTTGHNASPDDRSGPRPELDR